MKMSKRICAMVSTALISAMMMSMSGMSALAASSANPVTSINLTKTVTTDGDTYAPNTTFTFNVAPAGPVEKAFEGKDAYAGVEGGLTLDEHVYKFEPASVSDWSAAKFESVGKLEVDGTKFTAPGIYHYTVSETKGTYDGITYDETVRHLYVYVLRDGTNDSLYVDSVISVKEGATEKDAKLEFINDYGQTVDKTHDLIVTKEVTGNQGDRNKSFKFTIGVTGAEGEWYKLVKTDAAGTETEDKLVSGTPVEIFLKHGESVRIYGLSEADTYSVVENDADKDGYTTTDGNKSGSLTADGTQITVINNKDVTTPTGIIMSFAPYILILALAGVFAVMFLRKKKEDF